MGQVALLYVGCPVEMVFLSCLLSMSGMLLLEMTASVLLTFHDLRLVFMATIMLFKALTLASKMNSNTEFAYRICITR